MPPNGTNSANFNDVEIKLLFNSKGESLHIIQLFLFAVYFNCKIYFQSTWESSLFGHKTRYVLAIQHQTKLIWFLIFYIMMVVE